MMVPFFIFTLINFWVVVFSKKSFGVTLPATLTGVTLLTYFGQFFFHTFDVGVYVCIGIAAAGVILLVARRKDYDFISRCFSVGFFSFLVICLLFAILDCGRWLTTWDEYSHWGKMIKEMLRLDRFYAEPQSNLAVHKDYPPFASVFELLWCRLSLKYTEGTATMALDILGFSMILPLVLDRLEYRKKMGKAQRFVSLLVIAVVLLMVILNFDYVQAMTLNLDVFMPLFYVALIMVISDKELRKSGLGFITILLGQFGLIITKQMGISFVLLVWFFYTLSEMLDAEKRLEEKLPRMVAVGMRSLVVLVTPFISNAIWSKYILKLGLDGQFSIGQVSINTLLRILVGGGDWVQHVTFARYIRALFTTNISTGLFSMNYVSAVILSFCILLVMAYVFRTVVYKREMLRYGVLFALGSAGYALAMLTMYMFCFSEYEMSILASYGRYMSTYIVSQYLILLLLFIKLLDRKKVDICSWTVTFGLLGIGLLILGVDGQVKLMPKKFTGKDPELVIYKEQADCIQENVPEGTEVFLISNHNDVDTAFTSYYLDNRRIDERYATSNVATWGPENTDYWNEVLSCIWEDGYVYICDATENVVNVLGEYTADGQIADHTLYRVNEERGEFILEVVQ